VPVKWIDTHPDIWSIASLSLLIHGGAFRHCQQILRNVLSTTQPSSKGPHSDIFRCQLCALENMNLLTDFLCFVESGWRPSRHKGLAGIRRSGHGRTE